MNSILLIDDSKFNIRVLTCILEEDYNVYSSNNGKDGIELAKTVSPSLILVDIIMPGMDGFEVLTELKQYECTKDIPVIFITSISDIESEEKGFTLGAVDYITKPFSPSIVKARVKTHIDLFKYRKKIENIAMLDGLTSILNRRGYNMKIQSEWKIALNSQNPLSILIFDIDCFKQYNDNYGHLKGDDVIKLVASTAENILRDTSGIIARYGGEEFIVILPNTNHENGLKIAEDIRISIESLEIEHLYSNSDKPFITVSVGGMDIIPSEESKLEDFINIVDCALYQAKSLGRNRTFWGTPSLISPLLKWEPPFIFMVVLKITN